VVEPKFRKIIRYKGKTEIDSDIAKPTRMTLTETLNQTP
jgi:hypothetical protein